MHDSLSAASEGDTPEIRDDYFREFELVQPPEQTHFGAARTMIWQTLAGLTIGLGFWYLSWRWGASLNASAPVFSVLVAGAETAMFLGTLLFFHDIWAEQDTPHQPPSAALGSGPDRASVDIFVTTYNESPQIVEPSILAAKAVQVPENWQVTVYILDDGDRDIMKTIAQRHGVGYITRSDNVGFKAGNLKNALLRTDGEFVVVCDADTRLFPSFLKNTLGYFSEPDVAWVQTPHWFYDIPTPKPWADALPSWMRWIAPVLRWLTGRVGPGDDPFMSGSSMFFDVIQRRRNRNGASFCCGAASIHRRDAIFAHALEDQVSDRQTVSLTAPSEQRWLSPATSTMQPFRFHVSEDIFTSIRMHSMGWKSVFHPQIEARMLSPWSMDAWASQKLKYAGGTLDIFWNANPLFQPGMPWRTKLHYAATFWSYLSAPVLLILLLAPVWALFTGTAPVDAYSLVFFAHLVPFLIANELALVAASNGADGTQGRILSVATLPITLRAMVQTALGQKVRFRPTPKRPGFSGALRFVLPQLLLLGVMALAAAYGLWAHRGGSVAHTPSLLVVNCAWMAWNATALAAPVAAAMWRPASNGFESRQSNAVPDQTVPVATGPRPLGA
ncbi:glycosyltransferase family 2 protein [Shimia ponticola]|uniref:glycosyltransferase family 2 protein n=1 Tax=Shimia ponticola TaxID=2582893 RepID=UPI00164A27D3|nr:cellulose synthase catalytic subunit [Shimia ponticola]